MVTHYPPSPSLSSVSLSYRPASSSGSVPPCSRPAQQRILSNQNGPREPRRNAYPPSPPSSYTSPPSSYIARIYPSHARTSYTPSRVPSIDSRASTSAAHEGRHRNRTSRHKTSTEYTPQRYELDRNVFPWFSESGNVEITLQNVHGEGSERWYLLHGLLLAQNSAFFAHELVPDAQRPGVALPGDPSCDRSRERRRDGDRRGDRRRSSSRFSVGSRASNAADAPNRTRSRWHYKLDWNDVRLHGKDEVPVLKQTSLLPTPPSSLYSPPSRKPPTSHTSFFRNITGSGSRTSNAPSPSRCSSISRADPREVEDLFTAYDNLFLIFYNHAPQLSATNISTAYAQCKLLLSLAARYGALPAVASRVDHHLLRFHRQLWPHIAKYPASYLKLGYLAKSRAIFAEALIHVVGQWPAGAGQVSRGSVDNVLLDLVEDKVEDLEDAKARVDGKLFRLSLTTTRGDRVNPASGWLDWLAVSLFRQWFADSTTAPPQGILKDGASSSKRATPSPDAAYRLLGVGGQAYLAREELKRFLKLHPENYSRENFRRFERRIDELKHLGQDASKPLTRSFSEMDVDREGGGSKVQYLTCTRVEDRDFNFIWSG